MEESPAPAEHASAAVIGARLQRLREIRDLSREELSRRSGVSKTTILRLERGLPTQKKTLARVAKALRLRPEHLSLPEEDWNRPYQIHRESEQAWYPASTLKPRKGLPTEVSDPDERNRLGHLGYFGTFVRPINCAILEANMGVAVAEIYADGLKGAQHPGLEFLYVIRGEIVLTVAGDEIQLKAGEAITFWADDRHNYRPAHPVGRHEEPPQVLVVVLEGAERNR